MSHSAVGSYRYMSPERLLGEKYDASADVWSVGVTIVQLWIKRYPFEHVAETPIHLSGELQRFQLEKILPRTAGVSNSMREFLKKTLAVDPNDRASCMELSQALWFEACGIATLPEAHAVSSRSLFCTLFHLSFLFFNRLSLAGLKKLIKSENGRKRPHQPNWAHRLLWIPRIPFVVDNFDRQTDKQIKLSVTFVKCQYLWMLHKVNGISMNYL